MPELERVLLMPCNTMRRMSWLGYITTASVLTFLLCAYSLRTTAPSLKSAALTTHAAIHRTPSNSSTVVDPVMGSHTSSPEPLPTGSTAPEVEARTLPGENPLSSKQFPFLQENRYGHRAKQLGKTDWTYSRIKAAASSSSKDSNQAPAEQTQGGAAEAYGFFNSKATMAIPEVEAKPYTPRSKSRTPPLPYRPPSGEREGARRFPQAVIIGFPRCGTRALLDFLSVHPYVRARRGETHFYDRDASFERGFQWYLDQMPKSYSDQVTVERTSTYVYSTRARNQIHRLNPWTKLMVLIRDPVDRLVLENIARYSNTNGSNAAPTRRITKEDEMGAVTQMGLYHHYLASWFQKFHWSQALVINGDELVSKPLQVMRRVETFLGIPTLYQSENFVKQHDQTSLYCYRGFEENSTTTCHHTSSRT